VVFIFVDEEFAQKLSNLDFVDKKPLSPVDDLIEVFPDAPARKHLHIVVQPPPTGECQLFVARGAQRSSIYHQTALADVAFVLSHR
jgi:hypothetical protein